MNRTISCLLALGAAVAAPGAAASTTPSRLAIVVGSNQGMVDEIELKYAEADAEKVARTLTDLGGYDDSEVRVLLAPSAAELRDTLQRAAADHGDGGRALVFFYYSGHADSRDLHLGGTRLSLEEIRAFLGQTEADVRIALVDACRSGALIREKGASLGAPFNIDVERAGGISGSIVITSSSEDEVAQESDRLGGSFFTHFWVKGLYGDADSDRDGRVTLEEAYRFAHVQTVSTTIASSGGVQHPSYDVDLSGEGQIVLAHLARASATLRLSPGSSNGAYYVLDADQRYLLTEIAQAKSEGARVRLPPGRYLIKKREAGRVLLADVELASGEVVELDDDAMRESALATGASKGPAAGVSAVASSWMLPRAHGPIALLGGRASIFTNLAPGPELTAGYRFLWRWAYVEPHLSMRMANSAQRLEVLHLEAAGGAAVGGRLEIGNLALAAGLDAGLILPQQATVPEFITGRRFFANPVGVLSVAAEGRGVGDVSYRFGDVEVSGRAYAGAAVYRFGSVVIFPPILGGALGISYLF